MGLKLKMKNKLLDWAKNHRIAVWAFNIIFTIIFINVVNFNDTFNKFLNSEVCQSEIKQVNLYMASAGTVDILYLRPFVDVIDLNNPIFKPIFWIRDSLYNKGLSYLPNDDAERAMWWNYIKFIFFVKNEKKMNISNSKKYLDDVYNNLQNFYKYPIKNQKYRLERYNLFITTANLYVYDLIHSYKRNASLDALYKDEEQIKKIQGLLTLFIDTRINLEKYEPDTLKKYQEGDTRFEETVLANAITQIIIGNELSKNSEHCDKQLLTHHYETLRNLMFYSEHSKLYNISPCQVAIIKSRLQDDLPLIEKIPKTCSSQIKVRELKLK